MINAIIFDMDGVVSDTQKVHSKVESELLSRFEVKISPEEITKIYSGVKTKEFFIELLDKKGCDYNINALMAEKWEKMKELVTKGVDEIPGAISLIKSLHKDKLTLAIASASNWKYAKSVLEKLEVIIFFNAIITGEMVTKGKPDPAMFLLAAEKINVPPEQCVVIEDGVSGMIAAKSAEMKCIGLVEDDKGEYPTENLVTSITEITSEYIKNLK
jgi:HAD superfamily hydrolase (TIGR01509 family)